MKNETNHAAGLPLASGRSRAYPAHVKRKPAPRTATMSSAEAAEFLDIPVTTFYGLVDRGEIQRIEGEDPWRFDTQAIVKIAAARADKPKRIARDGTHRGRPRKRADDETVVQFGRVTPAEVARWKKCAVQAGHGENVWPWLRALANAAADKAGL